MVDWDFVNPQISNIYTGSTSVLVMAQLLTAVAIENASKKWGDALLKANPRGWKPTQLMVVEEFSAVRMLKTEVDTFLPHRFLEHRHHTT